MSGSGDSRSAASLDPAFQWGLASLLIGCTMLLAACTVVVLNINLFQSGPAGIDVMLAFVVGIVGASAVLLLGLLSVLFGICGWWKAIARRQSPALAIAGLAASLAGLVAWLIAGINLIVVLYSFT